MPSMKRTLKPASFRSSLSFLSHEEFPKRIKKAKEENAKEENAFLDLPPEVWGVVVGYLNTPTLGRLVLQTSKRLKTIITAIVTTSGSSTSITETDDDDAVWKVILYHMWGIEPSLELLERTTWTAEACVRLLGYNHFFRVPSLNGDPDPDPTDTFDGTFHRPLRYAPDDYVFVITAKVSHSKDSKHQEFNICKAIRGSEIPDFFATGEAIVTFKEPLSTILNKPYPLRAGAHHLGTGMRIGYTTCVTIIRLPDKKTVRSTKMNGTDCVGDLKDYSGNPQFYLSGDPDSEFVGGPYMSRNYGKYLMRHINLRGYCQITIEVSPHYMPTRANNGAEDSIGIFGFNIEAWFDDYEHSSAKAVRPLFEREPHLFQNITFAHFLDAVELRDWDQKLSEVKTEVRNKRGRVCRPEFIAEEGVGEIDDEWV